MTKVKVLDHGFVELVEHMGDDKRVVDAARVSISGEGVKAVSDDRSLLRYLLRSKHSSPFEFVNFTFMIKAPMFIGEQFLRHRMASYSKISGRYSILPNEFYIPDVNRVKYQSKSNKQGSEVPLPPKLAQSVQQAISLHSENSFGLYKELLGTQDEDWCFYMFPEEEKELLQGGGVSRELARSVLPANIYTQWYQNIDLWNLMHFLKLRMDSHAQWEIQQFAEAIHTLIKPLVPYSMEAFDDYVLNSVTFSAKEMELIREMFEGYKFPGPFNSDDVEKRLESKRERTEFANKLMRKE